MQDVEEFMFQGLKQTVSLSYEAGQAILRYEEVLRYWCGMTSKYSLPVRPRIVP